MKNSNIFHLSQPQVVIAGIIGLFCLIFLPMWFLTGELEDPKYVAAFLFFPLIIWIGLWFKKELVVTSKTDRRSFIMFGVFVLYALYLLVNWYILGRPYYGIRGMAYQWICLLTFLLCAVIFEFKFSVRILALVSIIAGCAGSLYAISEYFAWIPFFGPEAWPPRVSGLMEHKNPFGLLLVWGICWSIYWLIKSTDKRITALISLALVLQIAGLFVSDSRGALVIACLSVTIILVPLIYTRGLLRKVGNRYVIYATVFCIGMIPILLWGDYGWDHFVLLTMPSIDGSLLNRWSVYTAIVKLIEHHFVFGCGVGNFMIDNLSFLSDKFRLQLPALYFFRHAESEYLEVFSETGLIGFLFYGFFIFGAVILGIRQLKKSWNWERYVLLVLLCAMLLNGIYDTSLRRLPLGILLFGAVGAFWAKWFSVLRPQIPKAVKRVSLVGFLGLHCCLAGFFGQILVADRFFNLSVDNPEKNEKYINKALAIFPYHPDALYNKARIATHFDSGSITMRLVDIFDENFPDYRPTNLLRAGVFYQRGIYDSAIIYADRQLVQMPNLKDSYNTKLLALAASGQCLVMRQLQDSLLKSIDAVTIAVKSYDTLSSSTVKTMYVNQTGRGRIFLGGEPLKEAFRRMVDLGYFSILNESKRLSAIREIKCENNIVQ